MTDPDLRAITVTLDLDEGTGLSVRYGEMSAEHAARLLRIAAQLVAEHAQLLDEFDDRDEILEVYEDDEYDDDDLEEDE